MKITLIDQFNMVGGGQKVLCNLARAMLDLGHEIELLVPEGGFIESQLEDVIDRVSIKYSDPPPLSEGRKSPRDMLRLLGYSFSFWKYRGTLLSSSLVYINGPRLLLPVMMATAFSRCRICFHVHLIHTKGQKTLMSLCTFAPSVRRIIFASQFIQDDFNRSQTRYRKEKSSLLEGSLDAALTDLGFENRFDDPIENFNFVFFGRISKEKGVETVLGMARIFPGHDFFITGPHDADDSYYDFLTATAPTNVHWMGPQEQLATTISELRIHFSIVPSLWEEPFGLVPIESMALSCITFVSHRGEFPNTARRTGAFVFQDSDALEARIRELITLPPNELSRIAEEQRSRTITEFSAETMKAKLSKILELIA